MQTANRSYRSLSLIWEMHGDKLVMTGAIALGLSLGAGLSSILLQGL
ncbi:MAG: hypothetical protein AAF646_12060 [Pseudomonadota bacterium]